MPFVDTNSLLTTKLWNFEIKWQSKQNKQTNLVIKFEGDLMVF